MYPIILSILLLLISPLRAITAQAGVPPFEKAECPFDVPIGYRIECGFVSVPEDRSQPGGRTIKIGTAVVHSTSDRPQADPLVFLSGGPGGAIVAALPNMLQALDPILAVRDVVFFDQRGVGWSQPPLACPELEPVAMAGLKGQTLPLDESLAPYEACRDRLLGEGVNVAAYNTVENAADVEDLRRALGYDQINLLGVSYGTMLAQVVVRDYPDHIRSAVLDSAYPIWEYVMADAPASLTHYFETVFANCEQDLVCHTAYPEVRIAFAQLFDRLQHQPITLTNVDPVTREPFTFTIDHLGLIGWLIDALPTQLPGLLYSLRDGDYTQVLQMQRTLLKEARRPRWPVSDGMKTSVLCSLRLFQVTAQQRADSAAKYPIAPWPAKSSEASMTVCQRWPSHSIDARDAAPLQTAVPLLVIGGEYDPGSPPRYAETIAAASEHGYAFIVPGAGHAALISADPCANGIVYAFLNDPLRRPAGDCLANTRGSGFALRASISRWPVNVLSLLMLGVAVWSTWHAARWLQRFPRPFSWRISARLLGWWPTLISAAGVAVCLGWQPRGFEALQPARVVETIVPLLAGVQAALLFSPDDEPGLEVTLACPRPVAWTILERVAWVFALQSGIALAGTLVSTQLTGESLIVAVSRWVAPLFIFTGLGLSLTFVFRQAVLGVGLGLILWCGLMLASEQLTQRWPFLWPLSVYLQPDQPDYVVDRIFLSLLGLLLIHLAVTRLVDEERLLLGRREKAR